MKARRIVEEVGNLQLLAMLQLAVGHLGADHFSEAAQAAREAEEYFQARGADAFVATYRAHAVKEPAAGGRSPTKVPRFQKPSRPPAEGPTTWQRSCGHCHPFAPACMSGRGGLRWPRR